MIINNSELDGEDKTLENEESDDDYETKKNRFY